MSKSFEITFYRELVGDNGHCRDLPICVLQVEHVANHDRAVATAIRRFEQRNRIMHWRDIATRFEVCEMPVLSVDTVPAATYPSPRFD